jgi:hypothetical protein
MADEIARMIGEKAARQLSNTTKTPPQWLGATPRWVAQMLPWAPVEAGVYRANQAIDDEFQVKCTPVPGEPLPTAFINYEEHPREYTLSSIATTIQVDTRVSDLFRSPMEQVKEQLSLAVEMLKEKQESELLNNRAYGLLLGLPLLMRLQMLRRRRTPH